MSDLPKGWVEAPIGEICEVVGGATPKTAVPDYWNGDIPWLTPDDLSKDRRQFVHRGSRMITQQGFDASSTRMVPKGTVLFTSRAPIGYVAISAVPMCTNQGFKSMVPPPGVLSEYLYWYLRYSTPRIREMGSGTTFAEISKKVAASIPLPMPPTSEQQRIVDAIEEYFSRIDAADASLRSCFSKTEPLRKAVITSTLLARKWPTVKWGSMGKTLSGKAFPSGQYSTDGVHLLRPGNLHASGEVKWSSKATKWLPEEFSINNPKYLLQGKHLLMNLTAQSLADDFLGRVCLSAPSDRFLLNQRIAMLGSDVASDEYLYWVFRSQLFRSFVSTLNSGSLIQHISTKQLDAFEFPLPPPGEQDRIVSMLETKVALIGAFESEVSTSVEHESGLRQSILSRAFSGKLVPQCEDDEPADALLERIRAANESTSASNTRKKKVSA